MSIVLVGSTSGSCTLQEQAVAGNTVLTLPTTSGTVALTSQLLASPSAIGQIPFSTDGSTYTATAKIVSGTAVASTSGTSIDFTSIPSWVKRVTVLFNSVSTNGSSNIQVQVGAGSVTTSRYNSQFWQANTQNGGSTSGFVVSNSNLSNYTQTGSLVLTLLGSNTWICSGVIGRYVGGDSMIVNGVIALGGTLDRVRITTVNGTDTFDAGTINILYE